MINIWKLAVVAGVASLLLAACSSTDPTQIPDSDSQEIKSTDTITATDESDQGGDELESTDNSFSTFDDVPPAGAQDEFITKFSTHTIPYSEVISGGPGKDGIPSIDYPQFISVEEADPLLNDVEPVIFVQIGDDKRAYPIQIIIWHEIVNDTIGGVPVTITFCPLCNTAIAFERTVGRGVVLDFGTTGRLRYSNLIMYDRQTESWWMQATGTAVAGLLTGTQLIFIPAPIISWEDFKNSHPDGKVLSAATGNLRSYGRNPYPGYDDINASPFYYNGPVIPGTLPAMARVFTVDIDDDIVAYDYELLSEVRVINDEIGGESVVLLWDAGTSSPFAPVGAKDVGAATIYSREIDGQTLTFGIENDAFIDLETKSVWNVLGLAISGELEGTQLTAIVGINHFWFSWAAFQPDTRVYQLPD